MADHEEQLNLSFSDNGSENDFWNNIPEDNESENNGSDLYEEESEEENEKVDTAPLSELHLSDTSLPDMALVSDNKSDSGKIFRISLLRFI